MQNHHRSVRGLEPPPAAGIPGTPLEDLLREVNLLALERHRRPPREGQDEATPAMRQILEILRQHGPQTVPQVARLRATSRQNVQAAVDRLERRGWVESYPNPAHRRADLLRLTPSGQALAARAEEHETRRLAGASRSLPEAEITAATTLLGQLRRLLTGEASPETVAVSPIRPASETKTSRPPVRRAAKAPRVSEPDAANSAAGAESIELPVNLL